VNNPTLRGFFRFEKPFDRGFLAINALGDPADPITDVATGLSEERARELVHVALGSDTVPITIENIMPWHAMADVADRFRDGRIFVAGDSAHVMPPNGGFGGNTGVHDAHNLAWKIAMVLRGEADSALLDTYEVERRPVGIFTTEQAYARYVTRTAPYLGTDGMQPVAGDLDVELGYAYDSAAICGSAGPGHENPRESKGRPGTRAPHVWLVENGQRISTLDLYGPHFTLLGGRDADVWCDLAGSAAASANVPLRTRRIGAELDDPDDAFERAHGIDAGGALLVRPDGFVGWRARTAVLDKNAAATELFSTLRILTAQSPTLAR